MRDVIGMNGTILIGAMYVQNVCMYVRRYECNYVWRLAVLGWVGG